ncbi:hypothetical protein L345_07163, partial [Ophiophagus hannah]
MVNISNTSSFAYEVSWAEREWDLKSQSPAFLSDALTKGSQTPGPWAGCIMCWPHQAWFSKGGGSPDMSRDIAMMMLTLLLISICLHSFHLLHRPGLSNSWPMGCKCHALAMPTPQFREGGETMLVQEFWELKSKSHKRAIVPHLFFNGDLVWVAKPVVTPGWPCPDPVAQLLTCPAQLQQMFCSCCTCALHVQPLQHAVHMCSGPGTSTHLPAHPEHTFSLLPADVQPGLAWPGPARQLWPHVQPPLFQCKKPPPTGQLLSSSSAIQSKQVEKEGSSQPVALQKGQLETEKNLPPATSFRVMHHCIQMCLGKSLRKWRWCIEEVQQSHCKKPIAATWFFWCGRKPRAASRERGVTARLQQMPRLNFPAPKVGGEEIPPTTPLLDLLAFLGNVGPETGQEEPFFIFPALSPKVGGEEVLPSTPLLDPEALPAWRLARKNPHKEQHCWALRSREGGREGIERERGKKRERKRERERKRGKERGRGRETERGEKRKKRKRKGKERKRERQRKKRDRQRKMGWKEGRERKKERGREEKVNEIYE